MKSSEAIKMGRKREALKINNVTFKYSGTDNDLTNFLKAITYDYLVKNKIISDKAFKNEYNMTVNKKSLL